jgi:hypothetical protein
MESAFVDSFQNVLYTINFNANGITVVPVVTVSSAVATLN